MDISLLAETRSLESLRFAFIDEQAWDTSCGYAALASLLRLYRKRAVFEADLIGAEPAKVTLARLAELAQRFGQAVRPWRTEFDDLPALLAETPPLLVHYRRPEPHFALLLSVSDRGVVTADPARGLELLSRAAFEARWSGVAVEIADPESPSVGRDLVEKAVSSAWARGLVLERALSKPPP